MPNLCGVNQKLIVEALTTLKKGEILNYYILLFSFFVLENTC